MSRKEYYRQWAKDNHDKRLIQKKNWLKAHPEKVLRYGRKKRYGLTHEDFQRLLTAQGDCCKICAKPLTEKTACVDHSHLAGYYVDHVILN